MIGLYKSSGSYHAEHISDLSHRTLLNRFNVKLDTQKKVLGLQKIIQEHLFDAENEGYRTYLVYDEHGENAGIFSLRTGAMIFDVEPSDGESFHEIISALELSVFAVNNSYAEKYPDKKYIGKDFFYDCIVPILSSVYEQVGCSVIYLFAINNPALISYYMDELDFLELPPEEERVILDNLGSYKNDECKFLYRHLSTVVL